MNDSKAKIPIVKGSNKRPTQEIQAAQQLAAEQKIARNKLRQQQKQDAKQSEQQKRFDQKTNAKSDEKPETYRIQTSDESSMVQEEVITHDQKNDQKNKKKNLNPDEEGKNEGKNHISFDTSKSDIEPIKQSFHTDDFEFKQYELNTSVIRSQAYMDACADFREQCSNTTSYFKFETFCLAKQNSHSHQHPFRLVSTSLDVPNHDDVNSIEMKAYKAKKFYADHVTGQDVVQPDQLLPMCNYLCSTLRGKQRTVAGVATHLVNYMVKHQNFREQRPRHYYNNIRVVQYLRDGTKQKLPPGQKAPPSQATTCPSPYYFWSEILDRYACFPDFKFLDLQIQQEGMISHVYYVTAKATTQDALSSYPTTHQSLHFAFQVEVVGGRLQSVRHFDQDIIQEVEQPGYHEKPLMRLQPSELVIFMLQLTWLGQQPSINDVRGQAFIHQDITDKVLSTHKRGREVLNDSQMSNSSAFVMKKRSII